MIRIIIKAIIILYLFTFLLGCNASNVFNTQDESTISAAKLTQREKELLYGVGVQHQLVFDVDLSGMNADTGKFWIDHYKKGQYKGQLINLSSSISSEKDKIYQAILAIQEPDSEIKRQRWFLSFANGRMAILVDYIQKDSVATTIKVAEKKMIGIDKDIMIGVIAQGKQAAIIPENIFENEENMKELLKNEDVYIFRSTFK